MMNLKTSKIIIWILIGLMTLQFLAAGFAKFTGTWTNKFEAWGYPTVFVYIVGAIEVGAVVALYFTKFRQWGVIVLALTMIGAMVTHVMNDEMSRLIHNGIIILISGWMWNLNRSINR